MNYLAGIKSIDFEKGEVTYKLSFFSPELYEELEQVKELGSITRITQTVYKGKGSNKQIRKIYALLKEIALYIKKRDTTVEVNAKYIRQLYEIVKQSTFPIRVSTIDGQEHKYIPSLADLDKDERNFVIETILDRYQHVGFSQD